jgi:hypothetical protein
MGSSKPTPATIASSAQCRVPTAETYPTLRRVHRDATDTHQQLAPSSLHDLTLAYITTPGFFFLLSDQLRLAKSKKLEYFKLEAS